MGTLMDTVKGRKSVRTFDGNMLTDQHRKDIEEYIKEITNPFDIPVEFKLLNAKEHGLSSPVLSGEQMYVVGKIEKKPYADVAFGYSFEKLVLYAWTLIDTNGSYRAEARYSPTKGEENRKRKEKGRFGTMTDRISFFLI